MSTFPNSAKGPLTVFLCFSLLIFSEIESKATDRSLEMKLLQSGYSLKGDSVVFPDNSICALRDYEKGICGQEWKIASSIQQQKKQSGFRMYFVLSITALLLILSLIVRRRAVLRMKNRKRWR